MATARQRGRGYELRVCCGYDITGKKLEKYKRWYPEYGMTPKQIEKELERQKVLFEEEVRSGTIQNGNIRFYDFSKQWMETYAEPTLTPKTVARYGEYLKRINKAIGHIKLQDLTPLHLNAFYKNLGESGISKRRKHDKNGNCIDDGRLAPKTILEHHRLISKILSTAIKWQLLDRNVAERADPPKVPPKEMYYLNEDEARNMLQLLQNEPIQYRTMIATLIFTGLRRGELCGLEWKDIDFKNRIMHVVRTSQFINGAFITKEPKTNSGRRELTLSMGVCTILQEYKAWQEEQKQKIGDQWIENDRLFTQWNGKPIHPDTITGWFSNFVAKNHLPKVTLHSLRHTNATLMIAEGTDIRTVSNRLGHAQTSTTLNIYTHALKSRDSIAADNLDNILGTCAV